MKYEKATIIIAANGTSEIRTRAPGESRPSALAERPLKPLEYCSINSVLCLLTE